MDGMESHKAESSSEDGGRGEAIGAGLYYALGVDDGRLSPLLSPRGPLSRLNVGDERGEGQGCYLS